MRKTKLKLRFLAADPHTKSQNFATGQGFFQKQPRRKLNLKKMISSNSASLVEIAVFGGGCFWCTEAVFEELKGVVSVISGYTGGMMSNPSYEDICTGKTGHAEVIKITYNPQQITYDDLLTVFFATHDPTTLNCQGADIGTQYRSAIFYTTDEQKSTAEKFIGKLNESGPKVVTEVKPLDVFYEAEDYHKKYYEKNSNAPYCQLVINPKLEKVKVRFHELLKNGEKI